jgi:glyoxylase-like metal-dependent hydrolase (beta-lactamase superfamily II)
VVKKDPGSVFWCSSGKGKEAQVYGLKSHFIRRKLRAMTSIPPARDAYGKEAAMDAEIYRFGVGKCQCTAVADGTFTYAPPIFPPPAVFLFLNAPTADRDRILQEHSLERWGEWISPYTCLLINTGEHLVLVDTGAGGLGPKTGRLLQNLRSISVAPDDVETVILTHGHPDHIGGNIGVDGKAVFRKARYVMWKAEWDFWTLGQAEKTLDEPLRSVLVGAARKNLSPIQDQVDLITEEREIVPGISAVAAPGHTPGQMALAVSSAGEKLLCVADSVLHSVHLERPEWCAAVDLVLDQTTATRRKLLKMAASEKSLVMAFHFRFPGLGRVTTRGDAWQWQPAVVN